MEVYISIQGWLKKFHANEYSLQSGYMEVCESSLPRADCGCSVIDVVSPPKPSDTLHVFLLRRHKDGIFYDEFPG